MSRTFTNLLTHIVFSTKDREPVIVPELQSELYAYLGGLARELKGKAYGVNGTSDHIHMLRSEEHTSELQSHLNLVCRLLLEKKKKEQKRIRKYYIYVS